MFMLRKNYWYIELEDGRKYPFYYKRKKEGNPLHAIPEFHHIDGIHYILDIYELLDTDEYEIYDEEDSFVLIPKNHVKRVFYVE